MPYPQQYPVYQPISKPHPKHAFKPFSTPIELSLSPAHFTPYIIDFLVMLAPDTDNDKRSDAATRLLDARKNLINKIKDNLSHPILIKRAPSQTNPKSHGAAASRRIGAKNAKLLRHVIAITNSEVSTDVEKNVLGLPPVLEKLVVAESKRVFVRPKWTWRACKRRAKKIHEIRKREREERKERKMEKMREKLGSIEEEP